MTRLKSEVYKRRIRVKEFFFDFDRLRKGTITEDKFRSALSMLNIFMTEQDISELITRYKDSEGYISFILLMKFFFRLINYVEFCKSLDILFLDDEKAKEILSTTQFEKKIQNVFHLLFIFIYSLDILFIFLQYLQYLHFF